MGDSLQSWWCGSLFALTRSECCATIRLRPAAYPSGLRGRIANPLFVGSNPTAAFTLEQRGASKAARCLASWPRCVPGGARSAASACAAAWALAPGAQIPPRPLRSNSAAPFRRRAVSLHGHGASRARPGPRRPRARPPGLRRGKGRYRPLNANYSHTAEFVESSLV